MHRYATSVAGQTGTVMPGYFAKTSNFEKQAKNRSFNRKTSPTSVGMKIQQNEKFSKKI